jgi:hypothetical protein
LALIASQRVSDARQRLKKEKGYAGEDRYSEYMTQDKKPDWFKHAQQIGAVEWEPDDEKKHENQAAIVLAVVLAVLMLIFWLVPA